MSKKSSSDVFVSVALGSRDRSFSIWSTDLKRPLIVINDVFDQSVLDLSWSRDGKVSKQDQSPVPTAPVGIYAGLGTVILNLGLTGLTG